MGKQEHIFTNFAKLVQYFFGSPTNIGLDSFLACHIRLWSQHEKYARGFMSVRALKKVDPIY